MCLTRSVASVLMSCVGLLFSDGIIGSILTQTGMFFWVSVLIACILCVGGGALGSSFWASLSLSVVMVKAMNDGVFCSMSVSLVTRFDFVMIWMRQSCLARIWRHFRVVWRVRSIVG